MEGARLFRVDDMAFMEEIMVPQLVAEEAARDVDLLAPDNYDFLPRENLLGDDGGQSTKEVTLAINDDGCRGESGHGEV